jgi:acetyl esterase/lipase
MLDLIYKSALVSIGFVFVLCFSLSRGADRQRSENDSNPPNLSAGSAFTKQSYAYKTVGDCQIRADVYQIPDNLVRPAILWIHGGALIKGDRKMLFRDQLKRYLQLGCTVVSIDYRLAPETKLKFIIEDLQDAYKWMREKGPELFRIDPDRIAVIGHSAGGYLTLMTGFCVNPRPKALVSFYGYGDIAGSWYSQPDSFYCKEPAVSKEEAYKVVGGPVISGSRDEKRRRFYLYCRQQGLWSKEVTGHDPLQESKEFDPFCPVRNITNDYPPTLLLHGDKDTDVPFEQSVLMSEQLERHHVEHELIRMHNLGHVFDSTGFEDPRIAEAFDSVMAFLQKHLMRKR